MKKSYQLLVLVVLYLIALGIRAYWLSWKNGLHVDEAWSVNLSCYNDYGQWRNYETNKALAGKAIKEMTLCDNDSLKNVLGDIRRLWKDNRDSPHTNLYYSFLRLSLAGLKTGDIKTIIFRGGILNLVFFTVSFIVFFLVMRLLFPDSPLLWFVLAFCAFMSTAAISNTLFLRPYQIQETLFIIFCYCFIVSLNRKNYLVNDNALYISIGPALLLSAAAALVLLTGYYAIAFIGLFGLYLVYVHYKTKNYHGIIFYMFVLFLGFVIATMLYPRYLSGYFSYRAVDSAHAVLGNAAENIKSSLSLAFTILKHHFFTGPVVAVLGLSLAYTVIDKTARKKPINQKLPLYIFFSSLIYLAAVLLITPIKTLRYVMPVFPFLIILPGVVINAMKNRKFAIAVAVLLCACFVKGAFNQNTIEHIYRTKPDEYLFARDTRTPVFVANTTMWKYFDLVPYFNDEQTYYVIEKYQDIFLTPHTEFYLVLETGIRLPDPVPSGFIIEQEFEVNFFQCQKIVVKPQAVMSNIRKQ